MVIEKGKMEVKDIGELKFVSGDLDTELTVKEYFKELLCKLWNEVECFSGKRPLGNSDWQYDIYAVLIKNGIIEGKLNEYGYVDEVDTYRADELITKYIVEYL